MEQVKDTLLIASAVVLALLMGLIFGVLILLRPVTNRLLAPGQRLFLWGAVWVAGYLPQWMALLGMIPFPISLTGW